MVNFKVIFEQFDGESVLDMPFAQLFANVSYDVNVFDNGSIL